MKKSGSKESFQDVVALDFTGADHVRYEALSAKAQQGKLAPDEGDELDRYLEANSMLAIQRLRDAQSLHSRNYEKSS